MSKPESKPVLSSAAMPPALRTIGALMLMVAIAASLTLALDHFAISSPPGCGPQSGCDRATRSAWGTIPGIDWPVSLTGVAYFSALLAAWLAAARRIHPLLRSIAWLGAFGSIGLIAVMLINGYVCMYCLITHAANLLFVIILEMAARRSAAAASKAPSPSGKKKPAPAAAPATGGIGAVVAGALAFIAVTGGLAMMHVQTNAKRLERDEAARLASVAQMTATRPAITTTAPANTVVAPTTAASAPAVVENAVPFTGRWRMGPEDAPIRIVMFMDYQCEDCQKMESQAMALLQRRKDVSLSVKHFPMSTLCNPNINVNMHPNSCWAARAAEAAGMLRGNDGFWQMHNWLFQNRGSFTDASLPVSLQQMGYDPGQFIQMMSSNNTMRLVREDIAEGVALGLHYTPMIFINGVELRGFIGNPGALTRTVDELAATNPPPGSPTQDQPHSAAQKYVDDWASQPRRGINARSQAWSIGPEDAKAQVVVWSDYQQPLTIEIDRILKNLIASGRSVRYTFRHYPFDQSCNSGVQQTLHPFGCMAARAAEAAGALGGSDAFWKMHDWLLAHQTPLNDQLLTEAAISTGLDPAALLAKMNEPEIAATVSGEAGRSVQYIQHGIPTVFVNGKYVPRWKLEGADIMGMIVQQAEQGE